VIARRYRTWWCFD